MLGVEFHDFLAQILDTVAVKKILNHFPQEIAKGLGKLSAGMIATVMIIGELLNEYQIAAQVTLHRSLTLRIQPPLIITKDQIDYFIDSLDKTCRRMEVIAEMCENLDSAAWSR
jgi:putrescine aminotransferase